MCYTIFGVVYRLYILVLNYYKDIDYFRKKRKEMSRGVAINMMGLLVIGGGALLLIGAIVAVAIIVANNKKDN